MSKVLKDAALIVGVVAISVASAGTLTAPAAGAAATGFGATLATAAGTLGFSSVAALSTALGAVAAGLSVVSGLTAKKPSQIGNPMSWQADPQAGIPHVMGRAYTGGQIILRETSDKNNRAESIHTIYSNGPIKAFEQAYLDGVATAVAGDGTADISDRGKIVITTQRGLQPEPAAFGFWDSTPNLDASSKISGRAASAMRLYYDTKGGHTLTTEPQFGYVVQGTRVYDPRKDSTYPGGIGPQRYNDETTWDYAGYDNPYLKGLSYLIGYRENGKLVIGVGCPIAGIIVSQYVEGANVADANGWKLGGTLSSTDDKWQRLKDILQAGGGEPMRLGAQIGCLIDTPRVSLATISVSDVVGDCSVQATQSRRDRINAIVPRYMAEQDTTTENSDGTFKTTVTWGMVAGSPVVVNDYVTFDGKQRQKQIDYTYVQNLNQSQQLARYDIENAREFGPIVIPLKLRWMGYRPGDVVTANLPELGLNGQDILLLQRELSPQDMTVTMTARSETTAKHAFALGQTGTPPATPGVSGPPLIPIPANSAWVLVGGTLVSEIGTTIPVLQITGSVDSDVIDAVIFQYRLSETEASEAGPWSGANVQAPTVELLNITGVKDQTAYDVSVAYRMGAGTGDPLILGPATAGQTSVPWQTGVTGPGKPADNADNTSDAWETLTSRTPQEVVDDLAGAIDTIAAELMRGATWRADSDQVIYLPDGTPVRTYVEAIGTNVDGIQTFVAFLQQVGGDGTAKFMLTANADGHITGIEGLAGVPGSPNQLSFVSSQFLFVDDSGANPISALSYVGGVWRMHAIEVDTLKVGTAVAPVRAAGSSSTAGTYTGTSGEPPVSTQLSVSVVMPVAGWIEVNSTLKQGFHGSLTNSPWRCQLTVDGDTLDESITGGTVPGDSVVLQGAVYVEPGTHVCTLDWGSHTSITLEGRSLFGKGYPFT